MQGVIIYGEFYGGVEVQYNAIMQLLNWGVQTFFERLNILSIFMSYDMAGYVFRCVYNYYIILYCLTGLVKTGIKQNI